MKNIKQSMISWFAFSLTALSTFLAYGAFINMTEVTTSDTLTASWWNNIIWNIIDLDSRTTNISSDLNTLTTTLSNLSWSIPTWAIMAFNLTSCPTWRIAADWDNSTPDLRWQFLRWLNNFWSSKWTRSDWYQDPDSRTLWSYQADDFKTHSHAWWSRTSSFQNWAWWYNWWQVWVNTWNAWWANETRPKNVAVIFCVKN